MITIALPKRFGNKVFFTTVEVTKVRRRPCKSKKMIYIYVYVPHELHRGIRRETDYIKIKIVPLIIYMLVGNYLYQNQNRPVYHVYVSGNCTIRYR